MTKNYAIFATPIDSIATMTELEKADLLATVRVTYAAALNLTFDGLLPVSILMEFGAETNAIFAALGYDPKPAPSAWPIYK